jgi:hypothetical protein
MKRAILISLALMSLTVGMAQAVPAAGLNNKQIQTLKTFGKIVVPAYIPPGYELRDVQIRYSVLGDEYSLEYVCFCEGKNKTFSISGGDGGFGGPGGDEEFSLDTSLFGAVTVDVFKPGGQFELETTVYSMMGVGKGPLFYSFKGGSQRLDDNAPSPDKADVQKIIRSLVYLK